MGKTIAIARRELLSLFVSPIAYIVVGVFTLVSGIYFTLIVQHFMNMTRQYEWYAQMSRNPEMLSSINLNQMLISPLLGYILIILLFCMPALTMRMISEEKNQGTFELLLTSPITTPQIVLGKFMAIVCFFLIMLSTHVLFLGIIYKLGNPEWGPVFSGYLGLFLIGVAFASIGLFASSLTKNQIVAFFVAIFILLFFLMVGWAGNTASGNIGIFLKKLSLLEHFENFSKGIITVSDLTFYVTISVFFVLGSCVSLESLRWR